MQAQRADLTAPQWQIYSAGWTPETRFRDAVCGRRFGKTFLIPEEIRRAARLAVQQGVSPDDEIWYGAPNFKQAKRVFWRRLKRAVPKNWISGKPNETECSITLRSDHVIRLVGLDTYDSLRGSGLWFFVGDEWADCPYEAWTEVIRPMLATAGGHALRIGTPKGFNHFYDFFQLGQPGGASDHRSWLFTTLQGGNVPPEEIEAARRQSDARTFRQEYEATFETFAGRVLYAFVRGNNVKPCPFDLTLPLQVGMDFNVNPMTATIWQEHGDATWQVGEIVIPTSNTDEMADEVLRRYGARGPSSITVWPDPAGAQRRTSAQGRTDIGILRDRGFRVNALSSHPLVRDRVNTTNARFCNAAGERRAFVDPSCVKSIEAYERLVYKEGTSDPDKDGGYDHACDATGYYFFGRYGTTPTHKARVNIMAR